MRSEFWWWFLSGNMWVISSGSRLSTLGKHKSLVKREMETPPLKQVRLGIRYVLPALQARKESAAWRYSQSGPKRAPETDESRHSATPPQPCLLFSPICYSTHPSGRAIQVLSVLWSEKRRQRFKNGQTLFMFTEFKSNTNELLLQINWRKYEITPSLFSANKMSVLISRDQDSAFHGMPSCGSKVMWWQGQSCHSDSGPISVPTWQTNALYSL